MPNTSWQSRYSASRSVWNMPGSSVARVTGTPAAINAGSGCAAISRTAQVRGRAHLERDPVLGEVLQQPRIGGGADSVPDPLGAELGDRRPHFVRADGLPGVRHAVQPRCAGTAKGGREVGT